MQFGLKNSLGTFQRVMDLIKATVKCRYALVLFDDTVALSKTPEDHIGYTRLVLGLLKDDGVTVKLEKRAFFTNQIDYLGHV